MTSIYAQGFNKQNLPTLRRAMEAALKNIQPNVDFHVGNISFMNGECTIKVSAKIVGVEGIKDKSQEMLSEWAKLFGLDTDKVVRLPSGHSVKLVGYDSKKRKRPFVVEDVNTKKRYVLDDEYTRGAFKKAPIL